MTTSSEDVLAHFVHVKVKKNDGALYLMTERIAWMPNGKDTFTISHKYSDIKTQKISPEGKPKIQLQVVLHSNNATGNNESTTFQFVNPEGLKAQLHDRNQVKELLQHLLPKFQRKLSKEMEEKKRILEQNPELYELYKELVKSNVISTEDFWTNYAQQAIKSLTPNSKPQSVGVSAAFLSDIKPETDGCNGIKYNITKDIIDSIFRTYPVVKRKHFDNVPHKMTESEFWQKFFQSHYFHRDRSSSTKDLFSDCARYDDLDIKIALSRGIPDPFVDIDSFQDNFSFNDELCNNDTSNNKLNDSLSSETLKALIKRFNHHSIMVLDSCLRSQQQQSQTHTTNGVMNKKNKSLNDQLINNSVASTHGNNNSSTTHGNNNSSTNYGNNTSTTNHGNNTSTKNYGNNHGSYHGNNHGNNTSTTASLTDDETEQERIKIKKIRLSEKTQFQDLDNDSIQYDKSIVPLRITDKNAYLTGPLPNHDCDTYSPHSNIYNVDYLLASFYQQNSLIQLWSPNCRTALNSPSAIFAFGELSPGGALMIPFANTNLKEEISSDVQKELKSLTLALNQLLRQFWSCFPVTTPQLGDKLKHMMSTLNEFLYKKLEPFREKLQRQHYNPDLTAHLFHQIEKANTKFGNWKYRQDLNSSNGKK